MTEGVVMKLGSFCIFSWIPAFAGKTWGEFAIGFVLHKKVNV